MAIGVYWGDPVFAGISTGYTAAREMQKQRERQKEIEEEQKRKEKEKKIAMGAGLALGAVGGVAAAPLAGATALAGGVAGANIGLGVANAFTTGDAGPLSGALSDVSSALNRGKEIEGQQTFLTNRDRTIHQNRMAEDRAATDQNIRQYAELSTLPETGLTRSELGAVQSRYGTGPEYLDAPPGGAGPSIDFGEGPPPAPGPPMQGPLLDVPGPSPIPGMERVWGPTQYRALAQIERTRQDTLNNPEWVAKNGKEAVELQRAAIARQYRDIRSMTRPAKPKAMIPGPNGQMTPAHPGWNDLPNGGGLIYGIDGAFEQYVQPTKKQEVDRVYEYTRADGTKGQIKFASPVEIEPGVWMSIGKDGDPKWFETSQKENYTKLRTEAFRNLKERYPDRDLSDGNNPFTDSEIVEEAKRIARQELAIEQGFNTPPEVQSIRDDMARELARIEEAQERGDVIPPERLARLSELRARWKELKRESEPAGR